VTTLALRLHPGQDLRTELLALCQRQPLDAACLVTAVGSLTQANLRYAGQPTGTLWQTDLELVGLVGTLGRGSVHLHAVVSDAHGVTRGGHVLEGCLVRTTVELVLAVLPQYRFDREPDPQTGFQELVVHDVA